MNTEIITELKKDYPTSEELINKIEELLEKIQPLTKKEEIEPVLEELQENCNKLYVNGYKDSILDLQVIINEYRHKFDITDPREVIHWDNGKGFVQ